METVDLKNDMPYEVIVGLVYEMVVLDKRINVSYKGQVWDLYNYGRGEELFLTLSRKEGDWLFRATFYYCRE